MDDTSSLEEPVLLGIDVGSGSVRAGLFAAASGTLLASSVTAISSHTPKPDHVEQCSAEIWGAVCTSVKQALSSAAVDPARVRGLGFDATCSLVVTHASDPRRVCVSLAGPPEDASAPVHDVIMWMDHRATDQADSLNREYGSLLSAVGGKLSPEMQLPKLLWLKQHLPHVFAASTGFFDLSDWLVFQATGAPVRSMCATTCKWQPAFMESAGGWQEDVLRKVGLGDLVDESGAFSRIGDCVLPVGSSAGALTDAAAEALGLLPGTPVAVGMIDAHAGGVATIGAGTSGDPSALTKRMSVIAGTSTCLMVASPLAVEVPGVWGPYPGAMVPGTFLLEAGQSAAGLLLDHVVVSHPASTSGVLSRAASEAGQSAHDVLTATLRSMASTAGVPIAELTRDVHVYPDYHGNRSPLADSNMAGAVVGLRIDDSLESLAVLWLATIQALAYSTRHVLETLSARGVGPVTELVLCGGLSSNPLYRAALADACQCSVLIPAQDEAMLAGAAMLGGVAAGVWPSVAAAMARTDVASTIPAAAGSAKYHDAKYDVFQRMLHHQREYRRVMTGESK